MQPCICNQCGARFLNEVDLSSHRAEHAAEASITRGISSRTWYAVSDEWVASAGGRPSHAAAKSFFELQEEAEAAAVALNGDADGRSVSSSDSDVDAHTVPAPTPDVSCSICGEPFRKRYNEAAEMWVYTGAARAGPEDGDDLHHIACATALLPPEPPPSPPAPQFDSDDAVEG